MVAASAGTTRLRGGSFSRDYWTAWWQLQQGLLDCVVGVSLLREGIDLPQVSLVAVMDAADRQGFLRSDSALNQIVGRHRARHLLRRPRD